MTRITTVPHEPRRYERIEAFEVEDDCLIRKVGPRHGSPYEHRCPRVSFEQITRAAAQLDEQGLALELVIEYERNAGRDVTLTNVAMTLASSQAEHPFGSLSAELRRDTVRSPRRHD